MAERLIQQQFLRAKREHLAGFINLVPADKRLLLIKELMEKNYPSAMRYFMRQHFPTWRDSMIEDFTQSILHDFNAIKNARRDITEGGYAQFAARGIVFSPLSKHQEASERLIKRAFCDARPSGVNVKHQKTCGKTRVIDIVPKHLGDTYSIALSSGYSHFIGKIGTVAHRHYVILSGVLVMKPFDGVEMWCCEVADTRRRMQRSVYIGRCSRGRYGSFYASHARFEACLSAIEGIAAGRALSAVKGWV
jgi:hypothetical protein